MYIVHTAEHFLQSVTQGTMLYVTASAYVFCSLSVELEGVVDKALKLCMRGRMAASSGELFQ